VSARPKAIEEDIVTAQRHEQNLMGVTNAITAEGGDQIMFEFIADAQRLVVAFGRRFTKRSWAAGDAAFNDCGADR